MKLYDEEIERQRAVHRHVTGGAGLVTLEARFPTDTDGLRVAYPCPRCKGSVLAEKDEDGEIELRCSLCRREVCRTCGQEKPAGWCRECQGEPMVLKGRAGK